MTLSQTFDHWKATEPDDCEGEWPYPREYYSVTADGLYFNSQREIERENIEALATDDAINAKILEHLGNRGSEYDEPGGER